MNTHPSSASDRLDVVVGRLADQAEPLITALSDAGFRVIAQPGLSIETTLDPSTARRQLSQIQPGDLVVFVSVPAVTHALKLLADQSRMNTAICAAVGPATAAALARQNLESITARTGVGSDALLDALTQDPGLDSLSERNAWILGAPDGRTVLLDQLQQWCRQARPIHVYRRSAASLTADCQRWLRHLTQSTAPPPCLIATSALILSQLTELIDHGLEQLDSPLCDPTHLLNRRRWRVLLNSERIAETARELGYSDILIAPSAANDALVETLRQSLRTG